MRPAPSNYIKSGFVTVDEAVNHLPGRQMLPMRWLPYRRLTSRRSLMRTLEISDARNLTFSRVVFGFEGPQRKRGTAPPHVLIA